MCGRYGLPEDHPMMIDAFDIKTDLRRDIDWNALMPRYNVAPTDQVPVIYQKEGARVLESMRWGLIPFRTANMRGRTALNEQGKSVNTPINARAETVHSNGMFNRSFDRRRCIIPAGGFYEWKVAGGSKLPHWIYLADKKWMGFAGLYSWWKSTEGEWVPSCTIVTTSPNSLIEPIHDRMPVILTEGAYDIWLDPESKELSDLKEILIPYPPQWMATHQVAPLVNKVQNDGPELIQPQANPSLLL